MTLKSITIDNVKGISHEQFVLNIIPNKPSLLVAPNGFGKSSFASAFASLNAARLKLPPECHHLGSAGNRPRLSLEVETDGILEEFVADDNSNTISNRFDIYVFSSRLKAKATKRNMGNFTTASASLEIEQLVLVDRIPQKVEFGYKLAEARRTFGRNGKILKSIEPILARNDLAESLLKLEANLKRLAGVRLNSQLSGVLVRINEQNGTAEHILQWAANNAETDLESISPLAQIADGLSRFNESLPSRLDKLLGALQVFQLHVVDSTLFKHACNYANYLNEKSSHEAVIRSFDTTWKNVKPKEQKGKLVVDFPLASDISNGQRDSLSFAAWLQKVACSPVNRDCIIIIDEVFDYLDDANLVAVQYYISNLIKAKKAASSRIYPLILTHLNPLYFNNFAFKDQKVYFLKKYQPVINQHFKALVIKRNDATISSTVDRSHFHYDPGSVNLRSEFIALGLKETWGDSIIFQRDGGLKEQMQQW